MKDFFKSVKFKIILFLLAFLIGIMIFAVTKGGYSLSSVSFINSLTSPFKSFSNSISIKIENFLDKNFNATDYYNENQRLRDQVGELTLELAEFQETKDELAELKKFIGIKENNPDFVISEPSDIIGYTLNDPFKSFTINKGSSDGIIPYAPVVTTEGLIGIIVEVSENTSTVRTLLSPDLSVAVISSETKNSAVIEGYISNDDKIGARLINLSSETDFKVDDVLVTMGTSGLFPAGYPVGTVTKIYPTSNGLSYYADVELSVNMNRLSSVVVITDFTGKDNSDEN